MGCWGYGPFDSDSAGDWIATVLTHPLEKLVHRVLVRARRPQPPPFPKVGTQAFFENVDEKLAGGRMVHVRRRRRRVTKEDRQAFQAWRAANTRLYDASREFDLAMAAIQVALELASHGHADWFRWTRPALSSKEAAALDKEHGLLHLRRSRGGKVQRRARKAHPVLPGFWEEARELVQRMGAHEGWTESFRSPAAIRSAVRALEAKVQSVQFAEAAKTAIRDEEDDRYARRFRKRKRSKAKALGWDTCKKKRRASAGSRRLRRKTVS